MAKEASTTDYGKGPLKLKKSQSVTDLLKNAKFNENKYIQVTGVVTDVCPMKGCWIKITDPVTKKEIELKVKDDVIVFPKDSKGKKVVAEGKLVKKMYSKEKAIKHLRHRAEELGIKFDPKSVTGPLEVWQIKGKRAKVTL